MVKVKKNYGGIPQLCPDASQRLADLQKAKVSPPCTCYHPAGGWINSSGGPESRPKLESDKKEAKRMQALEDPVGNRELQGGCGNALLSASVAA